jgi:hypothetical protein
MRRKPGSGLLKFAGTVSIALLLVLAMVPNRASGGWIVCAGAKGWCRYVPPWHQPTDHNWSTNAGAPLPAGCATDSSNTVSAAASTGKALADVSTEVTSAPCLAGAYFIVGFTSDGWTAEGSDTVIVNWNWTGSVVMYLDCAQTSAAAFVYEKAVFGINLYDVTNGTWVYGANNQPATTNSTLGTGYYYITCAGGGVQLWSGGTCISTCHMTASFGSLPTTRGHTYETFAWMMGIDPTHGLQVGDVAFSCIQMDTTNAVNTIGAPDCYGSSSYFASLSSMYIL